MHEPASLSRTVCLTFARIDWQDLVNFGVLPLTLVDPDGCGEVAINDVQDGLLSETPRSGRAREGGLLRLSR